MRAAQVLHHSYLPMVEWMSGVSAICLFMVDTACTKLLSNSFFSSNIGSPYRFWNLLRAVGKGALMFLILEQYTISAIQMFHSKCSKTSFFSPDQACSSSLTMQYERMTVIILTIRVSDIKTSETIEF